MNEQAFLLPGERIDDDSLIPNPGESKDPCDPTIDLTIQKVWNDRNNSFGARPDSITVTVLQHWLRPDGTPFTETSEGQTTDKVVNYSTVTLSKASDERADSATWTKVVENLPVYSEENQAYFTYTVEETPVLGYTIAYKTSALNVNNTGTDGDTCLMFCAALKYDGVWSVSNNCLIFYNGNSVSNTASTWE